LYKEGLGFNSIFKKVMRSFVCFALAISLGLETTHTQDLPPVPPTVDEPILISSMHSAEIAELQFKRAAQEVAQTIHDAAQVKTKVSIASVDVITRAIASGSAFAYVLISEGRPVGPSIALGATAAALSAGFQVYAPLYKDFLTKKGIFQLDRSQSASFPETFFKEYLMQWLYLGVYHAVSVLVGVENQNVFSTVFWSWITEGTWSVVISSYALRLEKRLGAASKIPEYFYRSAFLLQCFVSSLLVTYSFHNAGMAKEIYWIAGGLGAAVFATFYMNWREIISRLRQVDRFRWQNISSAIRERANFEWQGIRASQPSLRRHCHNSLSWIFPFVRPIR
jgi:hypothetical protein